jgi:RNA polymerase sporulation-specific sigma factor
MKIPTCRLAMRLLVVRLLGLIGLGRWAVWYVGSSEALPPPLSTAEEGYFTGSAGAGRQGGKERTH